MAVVNMTKDNRVRNGDVFISRPQTDQNDVEYYRCIYLDADSNYNRNKEINTDFLLVFNFENHYPKDNIIIKAGTGYIEQKQVIEAIKSKWSCECEVEFINNDRLIIQLSTNSK